MNELLNNLISKIYTNNKDNDGPDLNSLSYTYNEIQR